MSKITKQSEIRFKVGLDEQNVPIDIKWQATDTKTQELRDCKSIMVSIWDAASKETLKIDLWTNEMTTDEMHSHFFQTLLSMAESYHKATKNPYVKEEVKAFAEQLAKKTADWENTRG
ncbi:MAG: gliding motility protein GldC [Bacteroidetes bacterium]|nr:gliding motility protein GldC [Bacteroidota bacterium]